MQDGHIPMVWLLMLAHLTLSSHGTCKGWYLEKERIACCINFNCKTYMMSIYCSIIMISTFSSILI